MIVSSDVIYHTREGVFHHISKHCEKPVPASRAKYNDLLLKSVGTSDWLRCVCGVNVVFNEMPVQVLLFCICVEHKIKNYCSAF